jgi:predicted aminopeptidase
VLLKYIMYEFSTTANLLIVFRIHLCTKKKAKQILLSYATGVTPRPRRLHSVYAFVKYYRVWVLNLHQAPGLALTKNTWCLVIPYVYCVKFVSHHNNCRFVTDSK